MHSVTDYKQSKQELILTHATLLCHFMAVLCFFFPSYLLLLITYFFLHSGVNKLQSNLSKRSFLLSLSQPFSRERWQLWTCGSMGKKVLRKKEEANGWYLDPGRGVSDAKKAGLLIGLWCLQGQGPGKEKPGASPNCPATKYPTRIYNPVEDTHRLIYPLTGVWFPLVKCEALSLNDNREKSPHGKP